MQKYGSKFLADEKRKIFQEISTEFNIPSAAIEKDWWVVRTLELVFQTEIAPHTFFKGGTSLSKAWNLIDRFSEDIDLALDRKFLGFEKADEEIVRLTGCKTSQAFSQIHFREIFSAAAKNFSRCRFH